MFIKCAFNGLTKLSLFCVLFLVVYSCKKDDGIPSDQSIIPDSKTIQGKVQKGPYKNGASLVIYELNSSLGQTGKSFASTISDDAGNFSVNNINLVSNYILITASGYYFNEHFNKISEGALYLEGFADVSDISKVNINILTHIIKPRIEQLISTGLDFNTSRAQAQNELLTIVGTSVSVSNNFESLDLSNDGFLFAMSLLFQRNNSYGYQVGYNYTAELSGLLSNFRNDFANNGIIDNQQIIDTLLYNSQRIDLLDSKIDLQNYFTGLGLSFSLNNFDQYIYNFQKKYAPILSSTISFPLTAAIMIDAPTVAPPYDYRENILKINQKYYLNGVGGNQFAIAAIVPYDSSLVVKFTSYTKPYCFNLVDASSIFGWKNYQIGSSSVFEAQRKNTPISCLIYSTSDSIKVEYFNNTSSTIPYYTKNIVF